MKRAVAAVLVLAGLMVIPAAAWAQPYDGESGRLQATDRELAPGDSVTVSGSGYAPGSVIVVILESTGQTLARVEAAADGTFSVTVSLPGGLDPGEDTIRATGATPDGATLVLQTPVKVLGAGEVEPTGAARFPVPLPLIIGVLVVLGLGAVVLARVRHR